MIYRIYDHLREWHGLKDPASDKWDTFKIALTKIARDAGLSKPIFDVLGDRSLQARFKSTSDKWQLTYDKDDEFALTIREHCEVNNQDFKESFVFKL
jgi:hypothetical protein